MVFRSPREDFEKYMGQVKVLYKKELGHQITVHIGHEYHNREHAKNLTVILLKSSTFGNPCIDWFTMNLSCGRKMMKLMQDKGFDEARRMTWLEKHGRPSEEEIAFKRSEKKKRKAERLEAMKKYDRLKLEKRERVAKLRDAFRTYPELDFKISDTGEISGNLK